MVLVLVFSAHMELVYKQPQILAKNVREDGSVTNIPSDVKSVLPIHGHQQDPPNALLVHVELIPPEQDVLFVPSEPSRFLEKNVNHVQRTRSLLMAHVNVSLVVPEPNRMVILTIVSLVQPDLFHRMKGFVFFAQKVKSHLARELRNVLIALVEQPPL
jgi:hypothetical protein